jgi:hypothetical protein
MKNTHPPLYDMYDYSKNMNLSRENEAYELPPNFILNDDDENLNMPITKGVIEKENNLFLNTGKPPSEDMIFNEYLKSSKC